VRCIELGAEDFIFKPFNPTLLRARVLATLEKKALRDRTRAELERKQRELDEARTLQLSLVPPPLHGVDTDYPLDIDVVLEPAREVGGDLVDHFAIGDDLIVLVLGDVSDKGAGAALMMARTHAIVRGLANRPDAAELFRSPDRAAAAVNAALAVGNANCMFVTFLMATLDLASGQLSYVRAGHIPPFLRGGDGRVSRLGSLGGPPLGLDGAVTYRADSVVLSPGDSLLVVTDGFTEAQRPDGNLFGEERIEAFLAGAEVGDPATRPLDRLVDLARAHEAGEPASDDIAAVLMTLDRSWRPAHGA
jgi:sigma-B regulation protein RsbU (phosphoserine phosphatase)